MTIAAPTLYFEQPNSHPVGTFLGHRDTLVVLVPHPDDESFGCGEGIAAAAEWGVSIAIILLTDGEGSHPNSKHVSTDKLRELRQREFEAAISILVPYQNVPVLKLRLPDGQSSTKSLSREVIDKSLKFVKRNNIGAVWTTWKGDPHCDHVTASKLGRRIAKDLSIPCWEYLVWGHFTDNDQSFNASLLRSGETTRLKKINAINCHQSQISDLISDDPSGFKMQETELSYFKQAQEIYIHAD